MNSINFVEKVLGKVLKNLSVIFRKLETSSRPFSVRHFSENERYRITKNMEMDVSI